MSEEPVLFWSMLGLFFPECLTMGTLDLFTHGLSLKYSPLALVEEIY